MLMNHSLALALWKPKHGFLENKHHPSNSFSLVAHRKPKVDWLAVTPVKQLFKKITSLIKHGVCFENVYGHFGDLWNDT